MTDTPDTKAPKFPTVIRKMWSGGEVQAWIDENWKAQSPWLDVSDAPVGVEVLIAYVWDATKYYRVARINTLGYWEGYSEEIGDFTTFEGGGDVIEYMPIPSGKE